MAYIPPELFCKIPMCLHKKIDKYLSHPVADLVKEMFKEWKAIFVENTNRDYVLSAKWRASEMEVYKSIQKKLIRQMKLDMKFGTNDSKKYREQLSEKRFENIVTKTMLDIKESYHPLILIRRSSQYNINYTRAMSLMRKNRWENDIPRQHALSYVRENMYRVARRESGIRQTGIRRRIPWDLRPVNRRYYLPGYACSVNAHKEVLVNFVQGLNPKARKSWKREKLLQSIYPNLRF